MCSSAVQRHREGGSSQFANFADFHFFNLPTLHTAHAHILISVACLTALDLHKFCLAWVQGFRSFSSICSLEVQFFKAVQAKRNDKLRPARCTPSRHLRTSPTVSFRSALSTYSPQRKVTNARRLLFGDETSSSCSVGLCGCFGHPQFIHRVPPPYPDRLTTYMRIRLPLGTSWF
jgi:hypothetical protein